MDENRNERKTEGIGGETEIRIQQEGEKESLALHQRSFQSRFLCLSDTEDMNPTSWFIKLHVVERGPGSGPQEASQLQETRAWLSWGG